MGVWSISAEVEWYCKNAAVALCRRLGQCQTQGRRDCRVLARTMVVCRGHTPAHSAVSREWGLGCCLLRSTLRTCCKWPALCSSGRPYRNARPRTEPRCSVSPPPRALCTLAASGPKCTWQHLLTIRTTGPLKLNSTSLAPLQVIIHGFNICLTNIPLSYDYTSWYVRDNNVL